MFIDTNYGLIDFLNNITDEVRDVRNKIYIFALISCNDCFSYAKRHVGKILSDIKIYNTLYITTDTNSDNN